VVFKVSTKLNVGDKVSQIKCRAVSISISRDLMMKVVSVEGR
jgi:hypothetical protein